MNRQRVFPGLLVALVVGAFMGCSTAGGSPQRTEYSCPRPRCQVLPAMTAQHVLWSYGTGNAGIGHGELAGPHSAEEDPFDPDQIVISEQHGSAILLLNRRTGKVRVLYGQRGAPVGGPMSAHFMPSGPYRGDMLITDWARDPSGEHRVMIIDRDTGKILWSYEDLKNPMDAIYWDDQHIMASDMNNGVCKIRLSDKSKLWQYDSEPGAVPFYRGRIPKNGVYASYGGDLLIGYWGRNPAVREIDTASKKTVWTYGRRREGIGDLWDRLETPVCALRYGNQERGGGLTIIVDERARILCVNRDKELVWELGGASGARLLPATPYLVLPTYISTTTRGTLLVTDWGRNMIYEISPFDIPKRRAKDAYLYKDYATTERFVDSGIIESRGYVTKLVQVYNKHKSNGVRWQVLGSHNAEDWQVIYASAAPLPGRAGAHVAITEPWNYLKAQARSATCGSHAMVDVYLTMRR